ncbi:Uracil-DNA glycosylase superfamily [Gluconacetobacter diazotrophicus PA1 5]|uniref:uracil-DNA glycosylase n=1 Tax=Gluconacetobacter diazotrophicus TaxID=33996 RepID=UPI000173D83A|nr:uracil-DNA glycosylase [Gluconacetobacter diazotrophicus]ACI50176.1 Uracil-DNA glycosylase superfamily [Gluconacetobacter diazotrophicus PA1 5]TWB08068.1 uracil-DNA glycosylase family 4 [Gluconacetobacter diazotrophicus]
MPPRSRALARPAAPSVSTSPGPDIPPRECPACPRLVEYRLANQAAHPDWWNAPVPPWGESSASLLIVGLAPGVKGANRTGRPFTGDYAGTLLYETLIEYGFATGRYGADPADGLVLNDCRIVNAVRCVPPANLPQTSEVRTCNHFLRSELTSMPNLKAVLTLGVVAHNATVAACGIPMSRIRFTHGQVQTLPNGLVLTDSYHVSRYNTNTGVLTTDMFRAVVARLRALIDAA